MWKVRRGDTVRGSNGARAWGGVGWGGVRKKHVGCRYTAEITSLHATTLFSWRQRSYTVGWHNEITGPSLKSRGRKTKLSPPTWLLAVVPPQRNTPCWTCSSSVSTFIKNSASALGQQSSKSVVLFCISLHYFVPCICCAQMRPPYFA